MEQLKELLDEKVRQYERPEFIEGDPISIPHRYERRSDIEVAGLLSATIAWGNRKSIVKSCGQMMDMLGESPSGFVMEASEAEIEKLSSFVYRTFQKDDLPSFVRGLRRVYSVGGETAMEDLFAPRVGESIREGIARFRAVMVSAMSERSRKHIADVSKGAAGKRMNMFLRWMVRSSARGVDFGLWKKISPASLMLPLDVHTARVGRSIGLLERKQNDWKAVEEITGRLREFSAEDPTRYDFALFSMGIVEHVL
ncbi:MAG: TIGR02757 family protein [Bacteroidales bacterium]|nr:TIGR02757 family protein [Bacteroidales bacterium]